MTVRTPKAVRFPIYLRVPGWCDAPRLAVNGKPVAVNRQPLSASARPTGFVMVDRAWRDGDVLAVVFPMPVRVRTWTANKDAVSVERGPLTFSVKIAEDYVRSGGTDEWPAWEIKPASPWNYGLVLDGDDPSAAFEVVKKPWPSDGQPFAWDRAPVEIRARARRIANWQENYWGLVDALQPSPVLSDAPVETITMIPMGAGRLRVSALPVIGEGSGAREWVAPPEPDASYVHEHFPLRHMTDGKEPRSSDDGESTYMSFWPQNNGVQWVTRRFEGPLTVSSVEVYWYDDHERPGGGCAVPNAWMLYYQDEAGRWAPVTGASSFGVERDRYNVTTFDPVRTRALKIEATLGNWSGGIHEWRVK